MLNRYARAFFTKVFTPMARCSSGWASAPTW